MNKVSKLCFGTLTLSPLQQNFSPARAADLMEYAFKQGINFFDTAEIYESYDLFREFLKRDIPREEVFISSKCYAYDEKTAKESLNLALESMETDYIDLFMLHEQESQHTLRGHGPALEYFAQMKKEGKIRHIGISSHYVAGVMAAADHPLIEVIHPIINKMGLGIVDGSRQDMEKAIAYAKSQGKFIFAMKALGGGHLLKSYGQALDYVLALEDIDALAIGMQSKEEIDANIASVIEGKMAYEAVDKERKLIIDPYCIGCNKCVERCQQGALKLVDGKAVVDSSLCVLCSYCVQTCEDFYIKVI